MQILLAPDKFKGSISAQEVAKILAEELQIALPQARILQIPVADGGDGALKALESAGFSRVFLQAPNAMGIMKETSYGISSDSKNAFIELAEICGIAELDSTSLNPWDATTEGLGYAIRHCLAQGIHRITISIGGSASIDGGTGLLEGLGIKLYNSDKQILKGNLRNLHAIASIDLSTAKELLHGVEFKVLTDVENPLVGPTGSAAVYGQQKGLSAQEFEEVDAALSHWASVLEPNKAAYLLQKTGLGAGGGTALPLFALFSAEIVSGTDFFFDFLNLEDLIKSSDLIITGEGSLDEQSSMGKIVGRIANKSLAEGKATVIIAGISKIAWPDVEILELSKMASSIEESLQHPEKFLRIAARKLAIRYKSNELTT